MTQQTNRTVLSAEGKSDSSRWKKAQVVSPTLKKKKIAPQVEVDVEKLKKQPKAKQATLAEKAKKEADKQKQDRINSILSMQADDSLIQEKERKGPFEISLI